MDSSISLLISPTTKVWVSSCLNDKKSMYGGSKMFDGNLETCWNSKQGSPQSLRVKFENPVNVKDIQIMFQGGFVGVDVQLSVMISGMESFTEIEILDPEDNNDLQSFKVTKCDNITSLQLVFPKSSDFYGRVIIYQLLIFGETLSHLG